MIGADDVDAKITSGPQSSFLQKQFTFEEYSAELAEYHDGKLAQPDPNDHEDPLYYRKYAHNVPPLEAYFLIPEHVEKQCKDMKSNNDRKVFYAWNNLTKFEKQGLANLKKYVTETKGV